MARQQSTQLILAEFLMLTRCLACKCLHKGMVLSHLGYVLLLCSSLPLQRGEYGDTSKDRGSRERPAGYDAALPKLAMFNGFSLVDARPDIGALLIRKSRWMLDEPCARE